MVKMPFLQRSLSTLAAVLTIPAIATASFAQAQAPSSLIGQTRCAKQSTAIFSQRAATSSVVRALAAEQSVTLSENAAQNGYIGVSAPAAGFVQTVNLKLCEKSNPNPNPNPKPSDSTCRRVVTPTGLLVRQGASTATPVVGQVAVNTQVTLTTTPATSKLEGDRIWVQIAKPLSGWVSNGFKSTPGTNLVNCK
jgi:hypothetical protein